MYQYMSYGLVRDAQGRPCVDDLKTMPLEVWEKLTEEDKAYLIEIHGAENAPQKRQNT